MPPRSVPGTTPARGVRLTAKSLQSHEVVIVLREISPAPGFARPALDDGFDQAAISGKFAEHHFIGCCSAVAFEVLLQTAVESAPEYLFERFGTVEVDQNIIAMDALPPLNVTLPTARQPGPDIGRHHERHVAEGQRCKLAALIE